MRFMKYRVAGLAGRAEQLLETDQIVRDIVSQTLHCREREDCSVLYDQAGRDQTVPHGLQRVVLGKLITADNLADAVVVFPEGAKFDDGLHDLPAEAG